MKLANLPTHPRWTVVDEIQEPWRRSGTERKVFLEKRQLQKADLSLSPKTRSEPKCIAPGLEQKDKKTAGEAATGGTQPNASRTSTRISSIAEAQHRQGTGRHPVLPVLLAFEEQNQLLD